MQFIFTKKQVLSSQFCKEVIDTFESSSLKKPGVFKLGNTVLEQQEVKKSTDISFTPKFLTDSIWGPLLQIIVEGVQKGVAEYVEHFSTAMHKMDDFRVSENLNIQRYQPGEAFYGWHCERAGLPNSNRVLVWMYYLNTIKEGGGTEFYYQNHTEKAEEGKLLIWPSDWTHLHRGVTSATTTKYIITGWFVHY